MTNLTYTRPNLTPYQKAILDAPERYTITEASTKTGKTASHIIWLFEQALQGKDGNNYWWIAPVYPQAEIAFKRMKRQVSDKDFFKVNESKLSLTLPNQSIITFKSAEKPDNLYGEDVYACVVDEFTRMREEANYAIRSTLTFTKGKVKYIGNVKGKKNWGYRLGLRAKQGERDYKYFKITAWDAVEAGILDREEVEQAQRDLPEAVFRELYLAEPSEDGSNPFGLDFIKNCIKPISTRPAKCYGVDLAKSVDWTVITGLDEDRNVCYYDRFQLDWGQTRQRIINTIGRTPTLVDATGVGDPIVEDLQRQCKGVEGFKYTSNSKQQLMEGLANVIQRSEIGITEDYQDELEVFEYEYTRTGVRYNAPEGLHDDKVNSLALSNKHFNSGIGYGSYSLA